MTARIYCNTRFKDVSTEELVEQYGECQDRLNTTPPNFGEIVELRGAIRDEVYARFSEHMRDIGMREFMVLVEQAWLRRMEGRSYKILG